MTEASKAMQISKQTGRSWLRKSLGAGFDVSKAVLSAAPFDRGRFFTFVANDMTSGEIIFPDLPDIPSGVADSGLAEFLSEIKPHGATSIVVEDDLAGRSDPDIDRWPVPSGFLEKRVIHWFDLQEGSTQDVVEKMKQHCASHILNAFICTNSVSSLGLTNGQSAPEELAENVAASLLAVIVYAFDETSFAVWTSVS